MKHLLFVENRSVLDSKDLVVSLVRSLGATKLDFLACNTLEDPVWKEFYDSLEKETGVVVGASSDLTGNLKQGGDWVMENTKEDVESVYFNDGIDYWQYLLDISYKIVLNNDLVSSFDTNSYSSFSSCTFGTSGETPHGLTLQNNFIYNRTSFTKIWISPNGAILFEDLDTKFVNGQTNQSLLPPGIYALLSDLSTYGSEYVRFKNSSDKVEIIFNTSYQTSPNTNVKMLVTLYLDTHVNKNQIVIDYIDVNINPVPITAGLITSKTTYPNAGNIRNVPDIINPTAGTNILYLSSMTSFLPALTTISLTKRRVTYIPLDPNLDDTLKESPVLNVSYSASSENERVINITSDSGVDINYVTVDSLSERYISVSYDIPSKVSKITFKEMPPTDFILKYSIYNISNSQFKALEHKQELYQMEYSGWNISNIPVTINKYDIVSNESVMPFLLNNPTTKNTYGKFSYRSNDEEVVTVTEVQDGIWRMNIIKFESIENVKITVIQSGDGAYADSEPVEISLKSVNFPNLNFDPIITFDETEFVKNDNNVIVFEKFIKSTNKQSKYDYIEITNLTNTIGTFDKITGTLTVKSLPIDFELILVFLQPRSTNYNQSALQNITLNQDDFINVKNLENSISAPTVIQSLNGSNSVTLPRPTSTNLSPSKKYKYSFVNNSNVIGSGSTQVTLATLSEDVLTILSMRDELNNVIVKVEEEAQGKYMSASKEITLNKSNFSFTNKLPTTLDISKLFPWETNSPEIDSVFVPLTVVTNSDGRVVFSSSRVDLASFNDSSKGVMKLTKKGHAVITVTQEASDHHVAAPAQSRYFHTNQFNYITNICFPAGTPVLTDQGSFPIEELSAQTLHGKRIVYVTKTVSEDSHLVCFEKDSLGENLPSLRTLMTMNHGVEKDGNLVEAREFVNGDSVHLVPYEGEPLYNVLLENHSVMNVNGLVVETLDPTSKIAKFYA
jgi:hypothetical protein